MTIPFLHRKVEFKWILLGFPDELTVEQKQSLERLKLKLTDACIIWNKYYSANFSVVLISSADRNTGLEITFEIGLSNKNANERQNIAQSALMKTQQALFSTVDEIKILSVKAIKIISETDTIISQTYSSTSSISFQTTQPEWNFEDIDLSKDTTENLKRLIVLIQNQTKIFDEWDLRRIQPNPKVLVNFYGPSGTGKTMSVHGVAKELCMSIFELNYSQVESKYLGEGPKNIHKIFEIVRGKTDKTIIFFDEADAILGKRVANVEQGSDQAINAMRSQMLFELDHFNGIVFFATNFKEIYDQSFISRLISVEFTLPDKETRGRLFKRFLVHNLPGSKDVDVNLLAEISDGLSGRDIRDSIISAAADMILNQGQLSLESSLIKIIKQFSETRLNRIKQIS